MKKRQSVCWKIMCGKTEITMHASATYSTCSTVNAYLSHQRQQYISGKPRRAGHSYLSHLTVSMSEAHSLDVLQCPNRYFEMQIQRTSGNLREALSEMLRIRPSSASFLYNKANGFLEAFHYSLILVIIVDCFCAF